MRARVTVTLTAEIDSPYCPGDDAASTRANVAGMLNHYLVAGALSEICDLIFERDSPEGHPNGKELAELLLKVKREEASLAKLLVESMEIRVLSVESHT